MNTRTIISVGIGIIIIALIAIIYFGPGIGVKKLNHVQETDNPYNPSIDWGEKLSRIAEKDERVQELIDGNPFSMPYGIVKNESYAEIFLRIGGKYHKTKISDTLEEQRLVGGKYYKISIDLNNETVISVEEVTNQTELKKIQWDGVSGYRES